ncbi:MAG: hypothetical protein WC829_00805 [Hyphomicrobium sp.]
MVIPTDLMFASWRQVFPAERMVVFGGRHTPAGVRVTSVADVTEAKPSAVHVRADSVRMTNSLIDFERTGAHFAVWMHSHPGQGPACTHPSDIDLNQERDLRRHYSDRLVNIIVVRDGYLRVWGQAINEGTVVVRWRGTGIIQHPGEPNVFRLDLT